MNHLGIFHAVIMGIVQGLTEFLPISSSAHLRLTPVFMGFEDPGTGFTAVIQLGTVAAVLLYFWSDLSAAFMAWFRSLSDKELRKTHEAKIGWAVFIGTLPVLIIAPLLKKHIETTFRSLTIIAASMIVMGLVMLAADIFGKKNRSLETLEPKDGWLPGLFQCLALVPGMSRSGSTITGAFLAGFDRTAAVRFSFLMSVPSVAAAGFYELFKARHELAVAGVAETVVATIVSFLVGWASIKFLIQWISKHGIALFTVYRLILGGILLFLIFNKTLDPMAGADEPKESAARASTLAKR